MTTKLLPVVLFLSATAIVSPAFALVAQLPSPMWIGLVSISNVNGEFSTGDIYDGSNLSLSNGGSSGITITNDSVPSLYAYASSLDGAVTSEAGLSYYMEIIGPAPTVEVSVQAYGHVSGDPGNGGDGSASLSISGSSVDITGYTDFSTATAPISIDREYSFDTGVQYFIGMNVGIVDTPYAGTSTASAFVDPMFTAPAGYSIAFSPGIGNSLTPVPEPSTWVMIVLGFSGLGLAGYRRAKASRVALAGQSIG